MCKILINKSKNIYIDIKDILSIVYIKKNKTIVNLKNWKSIAADRQFIELIKEFNIKKKGGDKDNMAKKPVKKGTKRGQ